MARPPRGTQKGTRHRRVTTVSSVSVRQRLCHLAIGFAFAVRLGGRPIEVALIRRHTIEVSELSIFVVVVVVFGTSCVGRLVVIVIVTTS